MDGYIVQLQRAPLARLDPSLSSKERAYRLAGLQGEQQAFADVLARLDAEAEVVQGFDTTINAVHFRAPAGVVAELRGRGYRIEENGEARLSLMDSVPLINADDVWAETDSTGLFNVRGRGIRIAIIDTGIDYTHPDLGDGCFNALPVPVPDCKVGGGYDTVNDDDDPMDDHGHGTHVAAIAAGRGALDGVAPDAQLFAYKVFGANGFATLDNILDGIDRSIDPNQDSDLSDRAHVLNLSFGGPGNPEDAMSVAVDAAVAAGSVVVVAAGNANTSLFGERNVQSPGVARDALTVGATWKNDFYAGFSSRGPVAWAGQVMMKPDLVAPGVEICAARWQTAFPSSQCLDQEHVTLSGTSMATPHIAGVAALLLQAYPTLTPDQVKAALKGSTVPAFTGSAITVGSGRADAFAAYELAADPPIARFEPISETGDVREIRGLVSATDLLEWRIDYAPFTAGYVPETGWTLLTNSSAAPATSLIHEFDTATLPDGEYILRLTVEDSSGASSVDLAYAAIDKVRWVRPLPRDVERTGSVLSVQIEEDPRISGAEITFDYSADDGTTWHEISSGLATTGLWDTAGLQDGPYRVRARVTHHGYTESEVISAPLTLESSLREGFPVRIPNLAGTTCQVSKPPCPLDTGWLHPTVVDLNGDGAKEILFIQNGTEPVLKSLDADGDLLWQVSLGSSPMPWLSGFRILHAPVVGDADGNGENEIYVLGEGGQTYVISPEGEVTDLWPNPWGSVDNFSDWTFVPRLSLADVDVDGRLDLIRGSDTDRIAVVSTLDGSTKAKWVVPNTGSITNWLYADYSYAPAIGNLDDDADLEIVAMSDGGPSRVYAYDWDGTRLWAYQQPDGDSWRPNTPPAIGDLDGDGDNEIVVAFHRPRVQLLALDGSGASLAGWPVDLHGHSRQSGPVLADLDNDGDLEVLARGNKVFAFHHDGSVAGSFPISVPSPGGEGMIVAGDVTGEGLPEAMVHTWTAVNGTVRAWDSDGAKVLEVPAEHTQRGEIVLTQLREDEDAVAVATSEGDYYRDAKQRNVSKGRLSLYVYELGAPWSDDAFPWPMLQRDVRRTSEFTGAEPGDIVDLGPRPNVSVSISGPPPACCGTVPAIKDGDTLSFDVGVTKTDSTGEEAPCDDCIVESMVIRQFFFNDCVTPVGDIPAAGESYSGSYDGQASSIRLLVTASIAGGSTRTGVSNCLVVDNEVPEIIDAYVDDDPHVLWVRFSERVAWPMHVLGDWTVQDDIGPNLPNPATGGGCIFGEQQGCSNIAFTFDRAIVNPNEALVIFSPGPASPRPHDRVGHELQHATVEIRCPWDSSQPCPHP